MRQTNVLWEPTVVCEFSKNDTDSTFAFFKITLRELQITEPEIADYSGDDKPLPSI